MNESQSPIALLRLGRNEDEFAINALLNCFRPYIWRFFLKQGVPSDDADDAAQNTLLRFLKSPLLRPTGPSLEDWTDARVFLYFHKIADNVYKDYLKTSARLPEVVLDVHTEKLNRALREEIDILELASAVRRKLYSDYQDSRLLVVFDRRFRDGETLQNISKEIKVSIGTVHNWLETRIKPAVKSVYADLTP